MDFDFSDLKRDVAIMDEAFAEAAKGNPRADVFKVAYIPFLAHRIGATLKPFLDVIQPDSPKELRDEMEFLYSKKISMRPADSLGYVLKGRFHKACGEFEKAVECFRSGYEIDRDPTRKTWPHLQPMERNASLLADLGGSLLKVGQKEDGEKFLTAARNMREKIKPLSGNPEPS